MNVALNAEGFSSVNFLGASDNGSGQRATLLASVSQGRSDKGMFDVSGKYMKDSFRSTGTMLAVDKRTGTMRVVLRRP